MNLTLLSKFQNQVGDFSNFVAFSENLNCTTKLEMRLHISKILTPLYDAKP